MKKFHKSLKAAGNGIKETLIHERNFKIMLAIALVIVGAMFYFPTSRVEKAEFTNLETKRPSPQREFNRRTFRDERTS